MIAHSSVRDACGKRPADQQNGSVESDQVRMRVSFSRPPGPLSRLVSIPSLSPDHPMTAISNSPSAPNLAAFRPPSIAAAFACLVAATVALLGATDPTFAEDSSRPNFVILIADDIGHDDLGCTGNADVRTPNIDALATEGVQFTNAFLTASSCSPSRSSMITGRYPHNLGNAAELHREIAWHLPSFPGLLREAGYYTALSGKNHMKWENSPAGEAVPTPPFDRTYGGNAKGNSGGHAQWVQAIEDHPAGQPFLLWLASYDAHRAWDADGQWDETQYGPKVDPATVLLPPALRDTPATRQDYASYLNEVIRFDHYVGRVVDHLKSEGLFDNTYLFVLTDNGRPFPRAKTRLHDDGMQTYLIVTGPAVTRPGVPSHSLVSTVDLAPTVMELADQSPAQTFQGESLVPVLRDPTASVRPYAFSEHNWHDYEAHGRSIRDDRWLLIRNFRPEFAMQGPADSVRSPSHQDLRTGAASVQPLTPIQADVLRSPRENLELYDRIADPHQVRNLAGEPALASIQERLASALDHWMEVTRDEVPEEITSDTFNRATGKPLPGVSRKSEDVRRPAPGVAAGAARVNEDGL